MRWTAIVFVLVLGATAVWWWDQPRTPEELFEDRCSDCHTVPSMPVLVSMDTGRLIAIMRDSHDAQRVITEAEARMIIEFLAKRKAR